MKKRKAKKTLSRTSDQRNALLNTLLVSLIKQKEIKTTLAKAKTLRPFAEKKLSIAIKALSLNATEKISKTRLLRKFICQSAVKELFVIAEKTRNRKGGYLRIIKLPLRKSDASAMAKISWVDVFPEKEGEKGKKSLLSIGKKDSDTKKATKTEAKKEEKKSKKVSKEK